MFRVNPSSREGLAAKILVYGRMIKFSHTIFALPFALSALILARWETPVAHGLVFWIILAMVGARSAAMGFNRLVDAGYDASNVRTAGRELPKGMISERETVLFICLTGLVFVISAAMISLKCFWFSLPVLAALFGYSYTKRITWLSHLVLGFVIGLAPLGVWLAVTGMPSLKIAVLSLALGTYIAGFDIIYACQDVEFDRSAGLHSLPARFGVKTALIVSAVLHGMTVLSFFALYFIFDLSGIYLFFLVIITALLVLEHLLVKPEELSRIQIAFYDVNSLISVVLLVAVIVEDLRRGL